MSEQTIGDPRIHAARMLMDALASCENVCRFDAQTIIVSAELGAAMLLIGGKLKMRPNGTACVEVIHDGAELLVEMPL